MLMIQRWCVEHVGVADMEGEIDQYWKMVEANLIELAPEAELGPE